MTNRIDQLKQDYEDSMRAGRTDHARTILAERDKLLLATQTDTKGNPVDRDTLHQIAQAGIAWPTWPDTARTLPDGWSWVERDDSMNMHDDDEAAARALAGILGNPDLEVAWFDRRTLLRRDGYQIGASCAIHHREPNLDNVGRYAIAIIVTGEGDPDTVRDGWLDALGDGTDKPVAGGTVDYASNPHPVPADWDEHETGWSTLIEWEGTPLPNQHTPGATRRRR